MKKKLFINIFIPKYMENNQKSIIYKCLTLKTWEKEISNYL